jgi:hypothetical protein
MNQPPETISQTDISEQRAAVEQELRLAKEYWLRTIQPHIVGRILRGVEFFVAEHAHWQLQKAVEKAGDWNRLCADKTDGAHLPVSVDVDLAAENFRAPEVPEMLFADNVKPEILAAIAAPLVKTNAKLTPGEAIHNAHELLMAAERYIGTLPEQKEETDSWNSDFELAFSHVLFAEILRSNGKTSGQLPLLPPVQQERNEGQLSLTALKTAVKDFWEQKKKNRPQFTEKEWNRLTERDAKLAQEGRIIMLGSGKPTTYQEWLSEPDEAIKDCMQNDRILLQSLCTMRWERFKDFWQKQQLRVSNRKPPESEKPTTKKAHKSKTSIVTSAATSPLTASKRQK